MKEVMKKEAKQAYQNGMSVLIQVEGATFEDRTKNNVLSKESTGGKHFDELVYCIKTIHNCSKLNYYI